VEAKVQSHSIEPAALRLPQPLAAKVPSHSLEPFALRLPQTLALANMRRSTFLDLVRAKMAPQPRRLAGTRVVFWVKAEIEDWLARQPIARGGAK
jgi:predicted DNA-binding transcriptional regulator AlpA